MRSLNILFVALFSAMAPALCVAQINWHQDLQTAYRESQTTGRLLLVHFYSDDCVWCDRLEDGAFKDPAVAAAIHRDFIPVKIHAGKQPNVARHFGVTKFPTDVVIDNTGLVHGRDVSPQEPQKYIGMLTAGIDHFKSKNLMVAQNQAPPPASAPQAPVNTQPPANTQAPLNTQVGFQTPAPPPSSAPGTSGVPATYAGHTAAMAPRESVDASQPAPIAMEGFCPVTLFEKEEWASGDRQWGAVHMGQTYLFSSETAQKQFLANPDRYAPVLAGFDVVRFFGERKMVPGSREFGQKFKNRIYLFSDQASFDAFFNDADRYDRLVTQLQERIAMEASANGGVRR